MTGVKAWVKEMLYICRYIHIYIYTSTFYLHSILLIHYIHVYIVFVFDSRLILGIVEKVCSISLSREIVRGENVES